MLFVPSNTPQIKSLLPIEGLPPTQLSGAALLTAKHHLLELF
jgi:hypothetical protein